MARWISISLTISIIFVWTNAECEPSLTTVNGASVCSNTTIFEENFDSLDRNTWKFTRRISSELNQEFVVYEESQENIYVDNGKLYIKPTMFDERFIQTGVLNIGKCTGNDGECTRTASGYHIIPPVKSAQIKTKILNFRYGTIEIRAKLPTGDWIMPQLWLESTHKEYGSHFNSGRIVIAKSVGNNVLTAKNGSKKENKFLETGVMLGIRDKVQAMSAYWTGRNIWNGAFHTFTLMWTPDQLTFGVDGAEKAIPEGSEGLLYLQAGFTHNESRSIWQSESKIVPFDKEFHLTLGLSVGGTTHFPDDTFHAKPWSNSEPKALLKFWQAREQWLSTWQDESLEIDYIKVQSL